MSDPVTNSEVEDVLSSIRRLVGVNKRPSAQTEPSAEPDRLVLTPQLRVAPGDVLLLEPEDAVPSAEEWYEFEEPPLPEGGSYQTEPEQNPVTAKQMEVDPEQVTERASKAAVAGENPVADVAEQGAVSKVSALSDKIAALETAIARTADQWEPDDEDADDYSGSRAPSLRWQDDVDLDARGAPLMIEPLTPAQSEVDGSYSGDEQVIDEAFLRDLVSEIVRQELQEDLVAQIVRAELQGDLGARITRNVRKLVRREIQQALAARDLD